MQPLELWGGIECTVNRVHDRFLNQLERNGHDSRIDDLERIAALGIAKLRYPILWELTAPAPDGSAEWRWAAERLERLASLGIAPIAGLLHHGSGPRHTHLLDPHFAEGLASYAEALANRFPKLEWFTPINEPLTTARFSALYGCWYPHARDDASFVRAALNQCRAILLAMQAIRRVIPAAKLVQTDDLGRTWSTPALRYQADFENERRWLAWDLVCGRIDRQHVLWRYLTEDGGASARELDWFIEHASAPDVIGINHYVTSERFLDERLERYPAACRGGNSRHAYADVEAARVLEHPTPGVAGVLQEAWERYRLPLAITEAHLGCTREEQMRWFLEVWNAAVATRERGVDVRAVTLWALLGSFDWDSLLTRVTGTYEPGAFDVRGGSPRPTALRTLAGDLAAGRPPEHPVLESPGWWRRDARLLYEPHPGQPSPPHRTRTTHPRPIWIVGASGTLGRAFARLCDERGLEFRITSRSEVDLCDEHAVEQMLSASGAWAVVNASGYVRVDDAERDCERCHRENVVGARTLAAACARHGSLLVCFSSDLVFDGRSSSPYVESSAVSPLNVYGSSKARAEELVLESLPGALIVRTSAFFGPWDQHNFLTSALHALASGQRFAAMDDVRVSPAYVPDLVHACLDLLIDGERGIWHLANQADLSWADFARSGAQACGISSRKLLALSVDEIELPAARPRFSVLGSERAMLLPDVQHAIARYAQAWRATSA